MMSKLNFRSPMWQILTIFSACFIYKIFNTHTKIQVSKSKTVVTRECLRNRSKYICSQNLESKLYLTKIFLKNSFSNHLPSNLFWQCILILLLGNLLPSYPSIKTPWWQPGPSPVSACRLGPPSDNGTRK
jgi:hypothetical protein